MSKSTGPNLGSRARRGSPNRVSAVSQGRNTNLSLRGHGHCSPAMELATKHMLNPTKPNPALIGGSQYRDNLIQDTYPLPPYGRCQTVCYSRRMSFNIGTAGDGFICFVPDMANTTWGTNIGGLYSVWRTTSSWTQSALNIDSAIAGIDKAQLRKPAVMYPDLTSNSADAFTMMTGATMTLTNNTANLTQRSGRLIAGHGRAGNLHGSVPGDMETSLSFDTYDTATFQEGQRVKLVVNPTGVAAAFNTGSAHYFNMSTHTVLPAYVFFVTGAVPGTEFVVEFDVAYVVFGAEVPGNVPLHWDPKEFQCAIACTNRALPKSRSITMNRNGAAVKAAMTESAKTTAYTSPRFSWSSLIDGARWLWNHSDKSVLPQLLSMIA